MEEKKKYIIIGGVVAIICLIVGFACYFYKINKDPKKESDTKSKVEEKLNVDETQKLKDGLTDSFYITIDGSKHIVDVVYKLIDKDNSVGYNTYIYFDNKKIENYESTYLFANSITREEPYITKEEAENYTLKDLKDKTRDGKIISNGMVTKDNFKLLRGNNGQDYIAIYNYAFYEDWKVEYRYLFILDENGNLVIKLVDYDNFSLSNSEKNIEYRSDNKYEINNSLLESRCFTKISGNNVYFYASTLKGEIGKITAYEYKLTLGDTLKFEKVNTYKNLTNAGGGDKATIDGLNLVMPLDEEKDDTNKDTRILEHGVTDSFNINVNGKKHTIDVIYYLYEGNGSVGYITNAYYDNKRIGDEYRSRYIFANSIIRDEPYITKDEAKNFTLKDLKDKTRDGKIIANGLITKDDFKIIKGSNGKEYVAIYSYSFYEDWKVEDRFLYILDENGNLVTKLVDYDNFGLSNSEKTLDYDYDLYLLGEDISNKSLLEGRRFTKIEENNIYFYSSTLEGKMEQNSITAYEYKLTLGDTLKFEKINTYNNLNIAGGDGNHTTNGLNIIVK